MARMVRKQIYITPEQNERLKREAAARRVSEAEVIRYGIDQLTGEEAAKEKERLEALAELRKSWEERRKLDVPQTGRTWTREDLYDRDSDR